MATGLDAIDAIDLSKLTPEGKPKKPSRLSTASAIRSMYRQGVHDDQTSARVRAQLQQCKDGAAPFNQAALNASGQGSRANFNTLMMQDLITKANTGRNDIIFSPKQLMTIEVEGGEPTERLGYSRIIATELSRTIRKWGSFSANTQRLIDLFDTHGVGIDYAPDDKDFRFEVAALDEFIVPRQVSVSAEKTPWAIARKDMTVTELYDYIEDEAAAAKLGWNVQAVKDAIGRSTTNVPTGEIGDTAKLQQQIKNNDLFANTMFSHVPVLHCWVREFDGTYSLFITEKDHPTGEFLFKQYSRYESVEEAFNYFCYGVGNGTLHSVRGLGHMIFALCQMHSRLMCQKADGVMLAESIMVQATSSNALQEASLTYLGPMSLLPQGFEVIERQFQGGSDRTMGYLGEIKGLMGQVSGRFMTEKRGGETYRNKDEIGSELEQTASGDSGSIDLFYSSWDRTIRRMCRRIIKGPKSDPLVAEFHRRVAAAGVTQDILNSIDHDSTYAYRTLGAGSPAARSLSFTKLMSLLPQLDEIGRKNLIYQFVANEVGYQNADEFASKAEEPRYNSEASIAMLENQVLMMGKPLEVLSYQMHGTHVQIHVPPLLDVLDKVERGELDPMQELPGLQATLAHLAAHGEELARDPSQLALYGQVKEAINNTQQVVTNMERKIKSIQAQGGGADANGQPAAPGSEDALNAEKVKQEQLKTTMIEFKLQLAQEKGRRELAIQQAKADQNLALNDAKGAEAVRKKMQYPQSDYSNRR